MISLSGKVTLRHSPIIDLSAPLAPVSPGGEVAPVIVTEQSSPYISTVSRVGQAIQLALFWSVSFTALALIGCSSPAPPQIGDDEMVGRPAMASTTHPSPEPRSGVLWYHIQPIDETLAVQMRLLAPPETATFFLPGPWAGRGDFDELISIGHARSPEGPVPLAVDRAAGRIDVETGNAEWVEVSYRVHTHRQREEASRFSPWQTESSFFAYAPTILILPSAGLARQIRDIPVEVHLPKDWVIAATWPSYQGPNSRHSEESSAGLQIAGFVAEDIRALRDAFVAAGSDWHRLERSTDQGSLSLTLTEEFEFDHEALLDAASTLTTEYGEKFGPYSEISGFVLPVEDDAREVLRGTGRRSGFVLEVPIDHDLDEDLLMLLAHEIFHMWNGHRIVPHREAEQETQWFKEGVTHYIALKTLARLELIDDRAVRRELATAGEYYLHNPIIAGGRTRPVDRLRLPYDKGLLIALALDLSLHDDSDGELGIEDWLAVLLEPPFIDDGRAYDLSVLRESFHYLTADLDDQARNRYERLVRADDPVAVHELFRELGLHLLTTEYDNPARLLPIDSETEAFELLFGSPCPPECS